MSIKNQIIWLTGASSGIGEALVYELNRRGASLIISSRNTQELERVKQNVPSKDSAVYILPLDISDIKSAETAAQAVIEKYGRIDVLINNAGVSQRSLAKETPVAVDEKLNSGFIIGFIKSIDPRLDIAFKYRNISKGFRSFQSSAFTQNTEANNEQGKSITVNFKVNSTTKIEGYADHFINYWPQYYNDGIRRGNIISIQYSWDPNKKTSYYIRLQSKEKDNNGKLNNNKTNLLGKERISNYRIHFSFSPYQSITVRYRTELSVYTGEFKHTERGFLSYLEIIYKPMLKPYSISARLSGFETGGYNSRIYAYERDILYYYAIPALQNLGFRNYILVNYKISKQLQIWLKWIHAKNTLNSPLSSQAESSVRITKEWRVQLIWKS